MFYEVGFVQGANLTKWLSDYGTVTVAIDPGGPQALASGSFDADCLTQLSFPQIRIRGET